MPRYLIAAALLVVALAATGANAQFGSIFGAPPRPPAGVPEGRQPDPQQQTYPPPYSPPQSGRPASPGAVQSQPLPPPPGVAATGPSGPSQPAPGGPPGQRPSPRGAPPPVDAAAPADPAIAEPPSQKIPNTSALFSGLDKITGRITNFDVAIGETVQFGALQVTPRICYTRPPTETSNTDAFIEVDEVTLQGDVKRIFTGWMFASSPGLHAVEHPIYDVWLTDCKNPAVAAAPVEPAAAPAQPARPPAAPKRPPPQTPPGTVPRR